MRTRDWLSLVIAKKEELRNALEQAYMRAAGFSSNNWQEEVLLHVDGKITINSNQVYYMPYEVLNNDAIYVGTIKWFDTSHDKQFLTDFTDEWIYELQNRAMKWADIQLEITIKDLTYMAEFEELDVTYV